jgi:hypothetical protein
VLDADKRILRLIAKWLKVGIIEDGRVTRGQVGAPQGAIRVRLVGPEIVPHQGERRHDRRTLCRRWRSQARSPHWLGHGRFTGAQVRCRLSPKILGRRYFPVAPDEIGSVRKIAPFGPSPAGGTRRFATLHSACPRGTTFLTTARKTYRYFRPRGWNRLCLFPLASPVRFSRCVQEPG